MATKQIKICYSGSLSAFKKQGSRNRIKQFLFDYFWTFNNRNIDSSTRSAYYLIMAVKHLKEVHQITPHQLSIELWGDIHKDNWQQMLAHNVETYFKIEAYFPKEISLSKLQGSDLLFLPLEKSNTTEHQTLFIPGKLFEYLNTGKPILALCEPSDCRTILENSGLGICVDPADPLKIADCLLSFINQPELLNNYKADTKYISQFSSANKTQELAAIFDHLEV